VGSSRAGKGHIVLREAAFEDYHKSGNSDAREIRSAAETDRVRLGQTTLSTAFDGTPSANPQLDSHDTLELHPHPLWF
jgi:hypothetical protein